MGALLGVEGNGPYCYAASVLALGGVDFPMDEQRLGGIPLAIGIGEGLEQAANQIDDAVARASGP